MDLYINNKNKIMNYNEEYFFIKEGGSPFLYLKGAEDNRVFAFCKFIEQPEFPYDVYMEEPIPHNHKLCDCYYLSGVALHVFSEKIKNVIQALNPAKTDFIPANLHIKNNNYEDFFIMNCYNAHEVVDMEESEYRNSAAGGILSIEKLVIDPKKLDKIPLSERLIITVAESTTYIVFHKSVVDEIAKVNPQGMHAISLDVWDSDMGWELND